MKRVLIVSKGESGASAVEFALVLPLLLTLLFGMFEGAWLLTTQIVLHNAVVAGARSSVAAREWEGESFEDYARQGAKEAFWIGTLSDSDIEVTILPSEETAPRRIEVSIPHYRYKPLVGFLPRSFLPENLKSKAVMPIPVIM
jgi:hypothetical protein